MVFFSFSSRYTHNLLTLAKVNRLHAINSAIQVDLTGQINAETVGSSMDATLLPIFQIGRLRTPSPQPTSRTSMPCVAGNICRPVARNSSVSGPMTVSYHLAVFR